MEFVFLQTDLMNLIQNSPFFAIRYFPEWTHLRQFENRQKKKNDLDECSSQSISIEY